MQQLTKYKTILTIAFFTVALPSCDDFLEVEPKQAVSDEAAITDKASLQTALRGAYRSLGSAGYYGENYVTLGYYPSGDIVNNTTGGAANLVDINFRSDDGSFQSSWTAIYQTINRVNHVIAKAPIIEDIALTPTERNQILGEASFIRALSYFDLARAWGGVPLKLLPTLSISDGDGIQRSTKEEVYAQVVSDLDVAESFLQKSDNRVRASKQTVWALRARLHLYREEWANAEEYATKVIEDPNYNLVKPFFAWFIDEVTETPESIFELAFSAQNPNTIRAQMQHPTNGGTYRYAPNDKLIALLNTPEIGGDRATLIKKVTQGSTTLYQGNLYYRSPATDPAYILRIAEQYLIRAEARTKLNVYLEGAKEDLNAVRDRAGLLPTSAATQDELLLAIEEERRFEFLWEAHRWFDLARTKRLKEVIEALDPNKKVGEHELVFPIPIQEVQLAGLTQNKDY